MRKSNVFHRLIYYAGLNDGIDKRAYIGLDFRPGLWIFKNMLWNSGLAHKYKSIMWFYKMLEKICIAIYYSGSEEKGKNGLEKQL